MHRALCRSGVFPHTAAAVPRDAGNGGKRRSMSDAPYRHDRRKHLHGKRERGYGHGSSCAGCRADGGVRARKPGDPHRPVFCPQPAGGPAAGRDPYVDPYSETKELRLRRGVYEARETAGPRDRNAEYRCAHRHRPRRDDLRGPPGGRNACTDAGPAVRKRKDPPWRGGNARRNGAGAPTR